MENPDAAVLYHDSVADTWDEKYQSGGFRQRAEFFKSRLLPLVGVTGHWLDAGCGSGYFSRLLGGQGIHVTGIDASAQMIAVARNLAQRHNLSDSLRFEVSDIHHLAFADGSFSGCLCLSVLEYLDHPLELLDELTRVIGPGGIVILSVPHAASPVRLAQKLAISFRAGRDLTMLKYRSLSKFSMSRHGLKNALNQRGLKLKKLVGFDTIIPAGLLRYCPPSLMFALAYKKRSSTGDLQK
jgi:2-polyprenyl-3-methyl-5-hydroxy-6-metoxy-1,4-benzoquinol methylase